MPDRSERETERRDRTGRAHRIEYRAFAARADDDGAAFDGYAATAWHLDSYMTAFAPGAWAKTLREQRDRVLVLWQHDPWLPIGKPTAMDEDAVGLKVSARVTEATQTGRDAMALLRDGVPLGLSVGFRTIRERKATEADPLILDEGSIPEWMRQPGSNPLDFISIIEEARLYEFSVVSFPANLHAEIEAVRADERAQAVASLSDDLRAGRLSPEMRALVADLAAAHASAAPPVAPARTDEQARQDRQAALDFFARTAGTTSEQWLCGA